MRRFEVSPRCRTPFVVKPRRAGTVFTAALDSRLKSTTAGRGNASTKQPASFQVWCPTDCPETSPLPIRTTRAHTPAQTRWKRAAPDHTGSAGSRIWESLRVLPAL